MMRSALVALLVLATISTANAEWQLYRNDSDTIASYNYDTFEPFKGNPSVWVKWHYVTPRDGIAGVRIQFVADCSKRKLYEISEYPYGPGGAYLDPTLNVDDPKEYPLTPDSLNEATYRLLCR
jgi:hypothetical protein